MIQFYNVVSCDIEINEIHQLINFIVKKKYTCLLRKKLQITKYRGLPINEMHCCVRSFST